MAGNFPPYFIIPQRGIHAVKILDSVLKIFGSEKLNKEVLEDLSEKDPEDAAEKVRAALRSTECCGGGHCSTEK